MVICLVKVHQPRDPPESGPKVTAAGPGGRLSVRHHKGVAFMTTTPDAASQGGGAISALLQEHGVYVLSYPHFSCGFQSIPKRLHLSELLGNKRS